MKELKLLIRPLRIQTNFLHFNLDILLSGNFYNNLGISIFSNSHKVKIRIGKFYFGIFQFF